jgi:hypothetical protein
MPHEDQHATELDHAEEVAGVTFPSAGESPEVFQPGEQAFDLPSTQVTAERSAILGSLSLAPVGSNHFDIVLVAQPLIQPVAVLSLVADQSFGQGGDMSLCERIFDQR